jgi:hypothetical protein
MAEGDKRIDEWWKRILVFGIGVTLIVAIIAGALALGTGQEPVKAQPVASAMPEITPADVFVRPPTPSGDNRTANIPVEIEMINIGKGSSGGLLVWVGAFDHEQPNLLLDDFSTSALRTMSDYSVTSRMTATGKPGSIVRFTGELCLPTGEYDIRLRIYEDGGNRTLVSGLIRVIVDKDSVKVPDPYKPEGSTGRSYSPAPTKGSAADTTPGFEALGALAAAGLALVVIMGRRRRTDG